MKELYFESSYLTSWNTVMIQITQQDGHYDLLLNETAFYPEGGGQPSDRGTIDGIPVVEIFRNDKGQVVHRLPSLPQVQEGSEVYCEIDWKRRFDHMQQHSGQHLLSAVCLEVLEAPTLSFHMGEQEATIDIATTDLSSEQLPMVERHVNEYIYRNLPVRSYFVDAEQLAALDLVKPPKVADNVRIVEIEGIEYNACGGTHVSRTGELGMIKLFKAEKNKGNIRLYFKCGWRALNDYNEALDILDAIAGRFNTGRKDIIGRFGKWDEEQRQQREELDRLRRENDQFVLHQLLEQMENEQPRSIITHQFSDRPLSDLQRIANLVLEQREAIVLFISHMDNKVVLAHNGHSGLKCGAFFKQHLASFGGKGGGSDQIAQAGFGSAEQLNKFYQFALDQLNKRKFYS